MFPSGSLTDMPHPPGWIPHTCFPLYLFPSHSRTHSLSHVPGRSCHCSSSTFDILPRSPPSGSSGCCCSVACTCYLCTTVNSLQQNRSWCVGQQGHRHRQMSQSQEESGTCPYQHPRPNRPAGHCSQPLDVFGDGVDFIIESLTSL